jgi:hypothetical protein
MHITGTVCAAPPTAVWPTGTLYDMRAKICVKYYGNIIDKINEINYDKIMCEHLIELDNYIKSKNIKETFRGKAWSENCHEWVYYDCILNINKLKETFNFDDCVIIHEYKDIKIAGAYHLSKRYIPFPKTMHTFLKKQGSSLKS